METDKIVEAVQLIGMTLLIANLKEVSIEIETDDRHKNIDKSNTVKIRVTRF